MNEQKTCGECRYYKCISKHYLFCQVDKGYCLVDGISKIDLYPTDKACEDFEPRGGMK